MFENPYSRISCLLNSNPPSGTDDVLSRLPTAKGARFDSLAFQTEQTRIEYCYDGTRKSVLKTIQDWATSTDDGQQTYFLAYRVGWYGKVGDREDDCEVGPMQKRGFLGRAFSLRETWRSSVTLRLSSQHSHSNLRNLTSDISARFTTYFKGTNLSRPRTCNHSSTSSSVTALRMSGRAADPYRA